MKGSKLKQERGREPAKEKEYVRPLKERRNLSALPPLTPSAMYGLPDREKETYAKDKSRHQTNPSEAHR
jgi:hypothetical protein